MSVPESRIEAILSDILGYDVDLENPKSRVEELLVALGALVGNSVQLDDEGLIPISVLPPVAFADCVTVNDQTARYALTTDDVQNGDTVYQNDTQVMYFVVDDTKLDQAAGYKALAAGIAAQAVADKNGNDITTTYATKSELSGKQDTIDSSHKLDADSVDDSNSTNKFNMQADWSQSSSAAGDFIKNKPTLGTASALDVASSGDASTTEVVKGDDTRVLAVSAQQDTVANGGNGYLIVNGIRLYVNPSGTPPTGNIPDGSFGLF